MTVLSLTLTPEAVVRLHDALVCLGKFSEAVFVEARHNKMILTALNPSKSAHASFTLDSELFFSKYTYVLAKSKRQHIGFGVDVDDRFTCSLMNKALLAVFKGRVGDAKERLVAVEKCELKIHNGQGNAACRLIVRMACKHGVLKTYKLMYEPVEVLHAVFDRSSARNRWMIQSGILRELVEHFGPRTEHLDIHSDQGRVTFTSYTEKIVEGRDVLKQPLHTSVAIDAQEFGKFDVEDRLHIAVSVKDFKAIVIHADTFKETISACYSQPTRPMQLSYHGHGMACDFTLMTVGHSRVGSAPPGPVPSRAGNLYTASRTGSNLSMQHNPTSTQMTRPTPTQETSHFMAQNGSRPRIRRPSLPPPKASLENESLFLSDAHEDRTWGEPDYTNEDDDMLGWDASADHDAMGSSFTRHVRDNPTGPNLPTLGIDNDPFTGSKIAPTQRVSEVQGIFDK